MGTWFIFALMSAVFAGLVAIFGKIGVKGIDSTFATTIRALIMALFLLIVSLSMGKMNLFSQLTNKALLFIIFSGVAGALSWLFYFYALSKGPASPVSAIDRTSIVFVFIFAALFLGEAFTWKAGLGAILISVGAILMTLK